MKIFKCTFYILLSLIIFSPILCLAETSLGIGAEVPDNGYNTAQPVTTSIEPPITPAENLYLKDFWASLITEENAKRPLNHTQFDLLFGWISVYVGTLLVIIIPILIILLIRHFYRKIKNAHKKVLNI